MKYIRTKDGRINYLSSEPNEEIPEYEIITSKGTLTYRRKDEVIKIADTIEELIQDCDMLYIHDLYPDTVLVVEGNIKPFGYREAIKLKDWLKYKNKFELYIKQKNGDYKLVAKPNKKGELELL